MQMQASLPAIPWAHQISEFGSIWRWETQHFVVTVNGDTRSCYYQIADKTANPAGPAKPFADGQAATFEQAEQMIRSTIGKAYKPALGYTAFAGALATTFRIATGKDIDLGFYTGHKVVVTVLSPDGTDQEYTGTASVQHYELVLTGTQTFKISPSHIASIRISGRTASTPLSSRPKANRNVQGNVTPGCTGKVGFMPGTVEHTGRVCPVHEEGM